MISYLKIIYLSNIIGALSICDISRPREKERKKELDSSIHDIKFSLLKIVVNSMEDELYICIQFVQIFTWYRNMWSFLFRRTCSLFCAVCSHMTFESTATICIRREYTISSSTTFDWQLYLILKNSIWLFQSIC